MDEVTSFLDKPMQDLTVGDTLKVGALTTFVTTVVGALTTTAFIVIKTKRKARRMEQLLATNSNVQAIPERD